MNLGCTLFRLTRRALAGFTRVAAQALGLSDRGTIAPGQRADLCLWRVAHPAELVYAIGQTPRHRVSRRPHRPGASRMTTRLDNQRIVRAPHGTEITCKGWQQERRCGC